MHNSTGCSAFRECAVGFSAKPGQIVSDSSTGRACSDCLGLSFGTNQAGFLGGFLKLNDAESMNFHCVPNQVLYQAEPLPDGSSGALGRTRAKKPSQIITSRRELPLSAGHLQLARWSSLKEESRFRLTAHISHGAPACPPSIKTLVGYGKSFPKVLYISKQITGDAALIHLFGTSIFNR